MACGYSVNEELYATASFVGVRMEMTYSFHFLFNRPISVSDEFQRIIVICIVKMVIISYND